MLFFSSENIQKKKKKKKKKKRTPKKLPQAIAEFEGGNKGTRRVAVLK